MRKLDLLTANDTLGTYPKTHYLEKKNTPLRPVLRGSHSADVCIIGGGLTGVSAALSAAQAGHSVILLEASRIGFGASGRNGGQISSHQNVPQFALEKRLGKAHARQLFLISQSAHQHVLRLCQDEQISIGYKSGVAAAEFTKNGVKGLRNEVRWMSEEYGYDQNEFFGVERVQEVVNSSAYKGAMLDHGSGHGDPLALVLGIAQAAERLGAQIFELSRVEALDPVATQFGQVHARHTILACNGYMGDLDRVTARHVMPINNFIIATEPLGEARANEILPKNSAVADSKFVVNYFRRSLDDRLLFGGGESYGYRFPKNLSQKAFKPMTEIFPMLSGVKIENAWGGTLAITRNRMPYVRRRENLWVSAGYSGNGVAMATYCGHLIARALSGDDEEFNTIASIPHKKFPGGTTLRQPLLIGAMLWYRMRDRLGV